MLSTPPVPALVVPTRTMGALPTRYSITSCTVALPRPRWLKTQSTCSPLTRHTVCDSRDTAEALSSTSCVPLRAGVALKLFAQNSIAAPVAGAPGMFTLSQFTTWVPITGWSVVQPGTTVSPRVRKQVPAPSEGCSKLRLIRVRCTCAPAPGAKPSSSADSAAGRSREPG